MLYLDMLRGVLGRVSGCPEDEAAAAMRKACTEFLAETRCWLDDQTVATTGTVPALPDLTQQVVDIVEASIEGEPVFATFYNDPALQRLGPTDWALTFKQPSGALTLAPTPASAVNLRLLRLMAPGPDSDEVPDWVWLRHSEALEHGCLARLLAQPKKAWSDPGAAGFHDTQFRAAITQVTAAHGINRKQSARRLRVQPS